MSDNRRKTNRVVVTTLIAIIIMVTAVVVLAYNNEWLRPSSKPGEGNAMWNVEFTSIVEGEKTGKAITKKMPYHTSTFVTFHVSFTDPGDSVVYEAQISNLGMLDSVLSDIELVTDDYNEAIEYEVLDISEGYIIKPGESKNFKVKVSYVLNPGPVVTLEKPVSIFFTFRQA